MDWKLNLKQRFCDHHYRVIGGSHRGVWINLDVKCTKCGYESWVYMPAHMLSFRVEYDPEMKN